MSLTYMAEEIEQNDGEPKLYELGFLFDPAIPEDSVTVELTKINQFVESHKGTIESSGTPVLRALAYTIELTKAGKRLKYSQAYFSWIKFRMIPSEISALDLEFGKSNNLLRHIILHGNTGSVAPAPIRYVKKDVASTEIGEVKKVTEAEIEKEVENLIASTNIATANVP